MAPSEEVANESQLLTRAFEDNRSVFELMRQTRTRRVGYGYRIDSGTTENHPVTGRPMPQELGPMQFVSEKAPLALTEVEESLLSWAACGPNGIVAWDISLGGGFHELVDIAGRTTPHPGNSLATDLLVINDHGAFIYNPGTDRSGAVEMAEASNGGSRYDRVLEWYRKGTMQILDERPNIDYALRLPVAPHATLMGPYQHNMNKPGSTWFLPVTDNGKLTSAFVNLFDAWAMFPIDEFNGNQPAGVAEWVGEGKLELPVPIAGFDQLWFQVETYVPGMMVQNIRLAAEAMGLGHWNYCGFIPEVLLGAYPDLTPGLRATFAEPNPKAPIVTGAVKCIGWPGIKESTMVPSPRFPTAKALVDQWYEEKYGDGAWGAEGENNLLRKGQRPWKSDETVEGILQHPRARPQAWVREAVQAHIEYCVENFGQFPVTFNPLQMHFGVVVHHLDTEFYDRYYKDGYVTDRHRSHEADWHGR
jgi:hypothetical protein